MKAIVCDKYGSPDVLEMRDVEMPVAGAGEVLVKVAAVALNAADLHLLTADSFLLRLSEGLARPKHAVLGADIAGVVEAVGAGVKEFKPGDEVFGDVSLCCWGGLAEYALAREEGLALKPANLTFEEAAAVPMAALTALQALRDKGKIKPGHKVLINGASGGVGTFAVQLAKVFEAEVTGVCSPGKVDMVRTLGADRVIDYQMEDFTRGVERYDLILAANGYHPIRDYQRALKPGGIYVMAGGSMKQVGEAMLQGPWLSLTGGKKMDSILEVPTKKDLLFMKELLEAGKVRVVIDRCYPLSQAADAMRYLQEGHARGKVVIKAREN